MGETESSKMLLELLLNMTAEQRKDRWAVESRELGFTVYGHTFAEAETATLEALHVLSVSFGEDLAALREFLDEKGVKHSLKPVGKPYRGLPTHPPQEFQREFKVPVGASRALHEYGHLHGKSCFCTKTHKAWEEDPSFVQISPIVQELGVLYKKSPRQGWESKNES